MSRTLEALRRIEHKEYIVRPARRGVGAESPKAHGRASKRTEAASPCRKCAGPSRGREDHGVAPPANPECGQGRQIPKPQYRGQKQKTAHGRQRQTTRQPEKTTVKEEARPRQETSSRRHRQRVQPTSITRCCQRFPQSRTNRRSRWNRERLTGRVARRRRQLPRPGNEPPRPTSRRLSSDTPVYQSRRRRRQNRTLDFFGAGAGRTGTTARTRGRRRLPQERPYRPLGRFQRRTGRLALRRIDHRRGRLPNDDRRAELSAPGHSSFAGRGECPTFRLGSRAGRSEMPLPAGPAGCAVAGASACGDDGLFLRRRVFGGPAGANLAPAIREAVRLIEATAAGLLGCIAISG